MRRFLAASLAALHLWGAAEAQSLVFSPNATLACIGEGGVVDDCAGASAAACMEATEGGYSTAGMNDCLSAEWEWWDGRLNASYAELSRADKESDAGLPADMAHLPRLQPALRDMQRAWIAFRDATCAYEAAQWGGGSGGSTALIGCLLTFTARQEAYLRATLDRPE